MIIKGNAMTVEAGDNGAATSLAFPLWSNLQEVS